MLFDSVEEFVAVAQSESFSKAAQSLGVSVANVSRKIQALENKLGVRLLSRTTRTVKLTDNGHEFFRRCLAVTEAMQETTDSVKSINQELEGNISISAVGVIAETAIASIIADFAIQHPKLRITIDYSSRNVNLVDDNIDFAIRYGFLKDSTYVAKKLLSRDLGFAATPKYLKEYGTPCHPDELIEHRCLTSNGKAWRYLELNEVFTSNMQYSWQSNSTLALITAAERSAGIVYLPMSSLHASLKAKKLVTVLDSYALKDMPTWLVYPNRHYMPRRVRLLIDAIQNNLDLALSKLGN